MDGVERAMTERELSVEQERMIVHDRRGIECSVECMSNDAALTILGEDFGASCVTIRLY